MMNKELGTKWFTFYTKIRPLLFGLSFFTTLADFMMNFEIYTRYWWMLLYVAFSVVGIILSVMVAFKSEGDYIDFVQFVRWVLFFEIISMAYQSGVETYITNNFFFKDALIVASFVFFFAYLLWYKVNLYYFKKRIIPDGKEDHNSGPIISSHDLSLSNGHCDNGLLLEQPSSSISESNCNPIATETHSNSKFCSTCGTQLTITAKYCSNCGKKVAKDKPVVSKKRTALIASVSIILAFTIALSAYVLYTKAQLEDIRDKAFDAMYNQDFSEAKYYFDQYPDVEETFHSEYAYVQAGILMEQGKYIDALQQFNEMDYPIPESIMNKVKEKVYSFGITSYRSNDNSYAEKYFKLVGTDYKRSKDYLTLIHAENYSYLANYDDLLSLIGFENTGDIILNHYSFVYNFLEGTWKTENKSHYFIMYEDSSTKFNLPTPVSRGTYTITNGIYRQGNDWTAEKDCFRFTIIGKNEIRIYCYQNNKTYTLYRQ